MISIPGFRVDHEIGRGAMARVFRAHQDSLDRAVALKVFTSSDLFEHDGLRRFKREQRVQAALRHPHLVDVYDAGEHEGRFYLVLELMSGGTLGFHLARTGPLGVAEVLTLGADLSSALAYLHENRIIHRDIKPGNILLTPDGQAKLGDFGLCRGDDRTLITGAGEVLGTPEYLPPEVLAGSDQGAPGDVYALGTVLYELLAGALPRMVPRNRDRVVALLESDPLPLESRRKDVPRGLRLVLEKSLRREPDRRPTAAAFARDLQEQFRAEQGGVSRRVRPDPSRGPAPGDGLEARPPDVTRPDPPTTRLGSAADTPALPGSGVAGRGRGWRSLPPVFVAGFLGGALLASPVLRPYITWRYRGPDVLRLRFDRGGLEVSVPEGRSGGELRVRRGSTGRWIEIGPTAHLDVSRAAVGTGPAAFEVSGPGAMHAPAPGDPVTVELAWGRVGLGDYSLPSRMGLTTLDESGRLVHVAPSGSLRGYALLLEDPIRGEPVVVAGHEGSGQVLFEWDLPAKSSVRLLEIRANDQITLRGRTLKIDATWPLGRTLQRGERVADRVRSDMARKEDKRPSPGEIEASYRLGLGYPDGPVAAGGWPVIARDLEDHMRDESVPLALRVTEYLRIQPLVLAGMWARSWGIPVAVDVRRHVTSVITMSVEPDGDRVALDATHLWGFIPREFSVGPDITSDPIAITWMTDRSSAEILNPARPDRPPSLDRLRDPEFWKPEQEVDVPSIPRPPSGSWTGLQLTLWNGYKDNFLNVRMPIRGKLENLVLPCLPDGGEADPRPRVGNGPGPASWLRLREQGRRLTLALPSELLPDPLPGKLRINMWAVPGPLHQDVKGTLLTRATWIAMGPRARP